jgi:para-aminobenzoate synthetase/4-amino-4-deoxychorismate lyase
MIRNDLGRIARIRQVKVGKLFRTEVYPTVLQITSTMAAKTDASIRDIFAALFPCASITGAPKVKTMRIISKLESSPRGLYTGAIGFMAPGRRAQFSVAIRTVVIDKTSSKASYGIGGGIVWDSDAVDEYRKSLTKATVLNRRLPDFRLLETILLTQESGFFLLDLHMRTSAKSPLRCRVFLLKNGKT